MNAEEFRETLERLREAATSIDSRHTSGEFAYKVDVEQLSEIWQELDKHRLEMEAADPIVCCCECDVKFNWPGDNVLCPACTGKARTKIAIDAFTRGIADESKADKLASSSRFDAIDKRLGEIARAVDTVVGAYVDHMKTLHGIDIELTLLAEPGYEATCSPHAELDDDVPSARLDTIEKRLDEIRSRADRHLRVYHGYEGV